MQINCSTKLPGFFIILHRPGRFTFASKQQDNSRNFPSFCLSFPRQKKFRTKSLQNKTFSGHVFHNIPIAKLLDTSTAIPRFISCSLSLFRTMVGMREGEAFLQVLKNYNLHTSTFKTRPHLFRIAIPMVRA